MKMNKHYNELKASYLFVDIAHKVAAYQEAHPEKENKLIKWIPLFFY